MHVQIGGLSFGPSIYLYQLVRVSIFNETEGQWGQHFRFISDDVNLNPSFQKMNLDLTFPNELARIALNKVIQLQYSRQSF